MDNLFRNKYRISSARLSSWNYANEGMYFITICTANRAHFFGEIIKCPTEGAAQQEMRLSPLGQTAEEEWYKTAILRPDMNLSLADFVVMPNHIHGILIIGSNKYNAEIQTPAGQPQNKFGAQSKNIASILRGYKSAVTTFARKNGMAFNWQARFHDHIIRSAAEFERISNYIRNNVRNWPVDRFYTPSLLL